jgi:hypothetical protein
VNLDAWHAELARARDGRRAGIESELGRHRERLERAVRREGKLRERWLEAMDGDDPLREQELSEAHRGLIEEREDARRAVERLEAELDAEPAPAADAMLDAWSDLRDAVRNGGDSLGELNARLRTEFLEFRMDLMDDGVVGILPILRERPSPASDISYDEAMARPLPSYEDYVRMQREEVREDPLWVTGEERIRPHAKVLAVSTEKGRDSQESWHSNLQRAPASA